MTERAERSLSRVLMQATLVVALILGMISGLIQLLIDLDQEKEAVELNAAEFIESILPAAEEALYDLDEKLAGRVADGLFTQRAISRVRIFDESESIVDAERQPNRTLPQIAGLNGADEIVMREPLHAPRGLGDDAPIGRIEVTVDRSIVAPAIVDRLLLYFLLACLKNFLLGLILVGLIYAGMARYFVSFANVIQTWRPGNGTLALPSTPRLLQGTEIDILAERVRLLTTTAEREVGHLEKTVEEQCVELERERELSGLQRQFVSMVSHEFRTPLAIIDGGAQRIERRSDRITPEFVLPIMKSIRTSVLRLTDLMDSVLAAARLEDGRIRLNPGNCALGTELRDLINSFAGLNNTRRFVVDIEGLPESIIADVQLLRQVFSNLLSNAVKYSPAGTTVTVKGWSTEEGGAAVSVSDQGVGIPKDEIARLSERFFRASTSTGIAGTGIGLHLVRHLIGLHEGHMQVESDVGKGSTFTVYLPAAAGSLSPDYGDDVAALLNECSAA